MDVEQSVTIEEIKARKPYSISMGPFGSNITTDNFVATGVPVIRGGNLAEGRFNDNNFVFLTEEKADELKSANAEPGDLVFTHRGTLGQVGIIPPAAQFPRYVVSQSQMKLSCDVSKVVPLFVFYFFRSPRGQHQLLANTSTTGVPAIARPLATLRSIRIPLPPLAQQRAIAAILGTLDDKIELNRRMNQTLEAIARAIFKSWFVDFDPVRAKAEGRQPFGMDAETAALFPSDFQNSAIGRIPQGWQVEHPKSFCRICIGGDWGEDDPFDDSVQVVCLRGIDLERLRKNGYAAAPLRWVKQTSLEKRAIRDSDILIAASGIGPVGKSLKVTGKMQEQYANHVIYSNFCKRLEAATPEHATYFDRWLYEMHRSNEIWEYVNGTSIPNLDASALISQMLIVVPPRPILSMYHEFVAPIYARLFSQESRALATIRDALLPRLVSGEIRIKDAEKMVGERV